MTNFLSGGRKAESSALRVGVGHPLKAMEDPTSIRGARAQGAGGVHCTSWGNPRGGGRAGGGLKPEVEVTMEGDRPPGLGDVDTFEDMCEFLVACSEYEQQMHITNQDGGDLVLARRRELVDSATQMMVADEFYDGKPWFDLSEEEIMQGLKRFAGVDILQTSCEDFSRQMFLVLKMDASVSVDSRVFTQKRAVWKYLADSGLTLVMKPDGREYTLKHGKVLDEAMAAGTEPLEFSRKVEKIMRFDIVTHDPDALFNIIGKQQRTTL